MTLGHLRNRILTAIPQPLTNIGNKALESFLELPNVEKWNPNNMYLLELSRVFDIGLPFSFLQGNATAATHRSKVGLAISRDEEASSSLISEIHAGALLSNWGATVSFVPRRHTPTPDIEASWGGGAVVDVEVARGETRQLHKAVSNGVSTFTGALQPHDITWNVTAFMADASNSTDLNAMFEAATTLQSEQSAEHHGKWYVRTLPLSQREDVVGVHTIELFCPAWWPKNEPNYLSTSTVIGSMGNPVVQLRSLIPMTSYMNPLLRKADSGQGRPGNPYLIALDVSELPCAHERIVNDLRGYFEIWNHVSAILLFQPMFYTGFERKEWIVSIHRNPGATIPLPKNFAAVDQGRYSIDFTLTRKAETL
ncbi:MAG: hypothetical protein K2Q45_03350 [Nitrosomonas sp.]|nr:hypothetical protein [Nitrosomonas sp.]